MPGSSPTINMVVHRLGQIIQIQQRATIARFFQSEKQHRDMLCVGIFPQ
jgi:hypothetical protein